MKLVYESMEHILCFDAGYICELIIENKRMFSEVVSNALYQSDGRKGKFILSINDTPVEFSKYADVTIQISPFEINRKSLLNKLSSYLEQNALNAENFLKSSEIISEVEIYMHSLSDELPFEITFPKLSIGNIIRSASPEVDSDIQSVLEKIFTYMELVRELDRDRLFIMINMRSYFSDEEMEKFVESAVLHEYKVLLIESFESTKLKNTKRFVIDPDLCEF